MKIHPEVRKVLVDGGFDPDNDFDVNGFYKHPGKFEGEGAATLYYYSLGMNGFFDGEDGTTWIFELGKNDYKLFPVLRGRKRFYVEETDDGFIQGWDE